MLEGVVKFFAVTRGFGFIIPSDGSAELFFGKDDCTGAVPTGGDKVTYDIGQSRKGPKATAVKKIGT